MKKIINIFIIFMLLAILTACGGTQESTTSMLKVIEKGHSSDYKDYWIHVYDPNNQTKDGAFKVVVKDDMVWNSIEENKEYLSSYSKKGDKPWILEQIEPLEIDKE